jgi:CHAP domain
MTHNQFIDTYNWKAIDIDSYPYVDGVPYIYQCTDLVSLYIREVHNSTYRFIRGGGGPADIISDWPNSFVFESEFELVQNNFDDAYQLPKQGDIMLWDAWAGNSYGHIAIVHQVFPAQNMWIAFEQNAGGGQGQARGGDASQLRTHKYTAGNGFGAIWGWLTPKSKIPVPPIIKECKE